MSYPRIALIRLFVLSILATILAQASHESGHLLVYQAYRHNPTWGFIGLVQFWGVRPLALGGWVSITASDGETGWLRLSSLPDDRVEKAIAAAAGPLASLLSGGIGLWLAYKAKRVGLRQIGLALAVAVSFGMLLYYLRSPMRSMGDEYDVATQFGIPRFVVEMSFALAFAACLSLALRLLDSWRARFRWLAAIFLGSVLSGVLLFMADGWVRAGVNVGHPIFSPLFGYSFPVFLTYFLALISLILWENRAGKADPFS